MPKRRRPAPPPLSSTEPDHSASPEALASLQKFLEKAIRSAPGTTVVRRPASPPPAPVEIAYVVDVSRSSSDRLHFLVVERLRPPGARPGPWQELPVTRARASGCLDPDDRAILAALRDAATSTASNALIREDPMRRGSKETPKPAGASRFTLSRAARERILPMACRTGRCRLRLDSAERASLVLQWNDAPWQLRLQVSVAAGASIESDAIGEAWDVSGVLRRGDEIAQLGEIDILFEGGLVILRGRAGRLDDGGASSWLGLLRQHAHVRITAARRAAFFEELYGLPVPPPLDLPAGRAPAEITVHPRPRVALLTPSEGEIAQSPLVQAALFFDYEGAAIPASKPGKIAFDSDHERLIRRDIEREAEARARLIELGFQPTSFGAAGRSSPALLAPEAHYQLAPGRLPAVVSALVAEGFVVEAAGRRYRRPIGWSAKLRSGIDWLDLAGNFDFEGVAVSLSSVVEALRRGETSIVIGDGTLGMLPEEWLSRHGLLARLGDVHKGHLRFRRSQAALIDALLSGQPGVRFDEAFERARADLAAATITSVDPPTNFRGELRAYQREGLGWLHFLARCGLGGCLADDMGLGKTVQVLAFLLGRKGTSKKPSLVVAPRSLLFNWKQEAARFAPDLRVLDHSGADREASSARFGAYELVLTTYGTLRRDADALADVELDYAILDEAQAIKNDASDTSRAARRLLADHRLALSGTPVENHIGELWSIFEFLNPGMLGRASAFKAAAADRPDPSSISLLARALRPFLLRRTKGQVAADLPERQEETRMCELNEPQRALYEELRLHYRTDLQRRASEGGLGRSRIHVLEALLRLRQAACHPGLVDPSRRGDRSAKIDMLLAELPILHEKGQKALVFSQFTSLLGIVREGLAAQGIEHEYLDGQTRDRQACVERFQRDPSCSVFLISLKAGGVGLNLTSAEYVFLLDPWWNPAAEAQAIDRAHRIGQTRPVFAYRLIARDTIEERIAELQKTKRRLAESVIEGDGGSVGELSAEDLDLLLS